MRQVFPGVRHSAQIQKICCLFWLVCSLGVVCHAQEAVKIENGWVRAVPPSVSDSVAYMTLVNTSDRPLHLTGGSTPVAESAMLMITTKKMVSGREIMGMEMVDQLLIPAHGRLTLAPQGDHLMLMKLKEHPKPGDKVKLTLYFERGQKEIRTELPVVLK